MKWMLNCQETTELISKSLDVSLSLHESVLVKMHLFLCDRCREYSTQFRFFYNILGMPTEQEQVHLSEEQKQTIKKALKENQAPT